LLFLIFELFEGVGTMKPKALKTNSKQRGRGRLRGKSLRGERLVKAARMALAHMVTLSPKTDPINIARLATWLQVTRQAIYDNNLKEVVTEHAELQRKNFASATEATVLRRPQEARIITLEKENQELRRQLDGWIERWVTVEYNARMQGIDADLIFAQMPPPQRKMLTKWKRVTGK
jgi:hypothetical protein